MKPAVGWTLLSRDALKRAETQLRDDLEGVRDEIGFLALHQAYADRFFPGTSVLHTRLRYALFVPWLYQRLIERGEGRRVDSVLEHEEVLLAGRLKKSNEQGIVGGRTYPQPSAQPSSLIYWTALGVWRVLRPLPDGGYPGRSVIHRAIARRSSVLRVHDRVHDDDRRLLEEPEELFSAIPCPPPAWNNAGEALNFKLLVGEARFLRNSLLGVRRPGTDSIPSLLARLVDLPLTDATDLYGVKVSRVADEADRAALVRAEQVAALAAIGRAVYAALVEETRDRDGVPTEHTHRSNLAVVVERYRDSALALDINAVEQDIPNMLAGGAGGSTMSQVLQNTQTWLTQRDLPLDRVYSIYRDAERRKGRRARLAMTLSGRQRRAEWIPEKHPYAVPLHYRWGNVRRLLLDLRSAV